VNNTTGDNAENSASRDPKELAPALKTIRRRRLLLWGIILVYLPAMWTILQITQSYHKTAVAFVIWVILLTTIATYAAMVRCPACGNYFHMHGATLLYLRKCLHCGLHINADRK
jgi:hypothetical protein